MNNKFCTKCGKEIEEGASFCINCGTKISQDNNVESENNNIQTEVVNEQPVNNQAVVQSNTDNTVNTNQKEDESKSVLLGVLSLVSIYVIPIIGIELEDLLPNGIGVWILPFSPLIGIVLMIIGRVKYPNNKFLKVVTWIVIMNIVLGIISFILLFALCYITCGSIDTRGCG